MWWPCRAPVEEHMLKVLFEVVFAVSRACVFVLAMSHARVFALAVSHARGVSYA